MDLAFALNRWKIFPCIETFAALFQELSESFG